MKKSWITGSTIAAAVALATVTAFAHGGATGIVKERMDLMGDLGKNMKSLKSMMSGESAYDAGQVRAVSLAIAGHGGANMTKLFPEGSDHKPTEALPSVWKDWDRFSDLADKLESYAKALEQAAGNERPSQEGGMMSGGAMMGTDMMGAGTLHAANARTFGKNATRCSLHGPGRHLLRLSSGFPKREEEVT